VGAAAGDLTRNNLERKIIGRPILEKEVGGVILIGIKNVERATGA